MAHVVVTLKIMPESPDTNLKKLEEISKEKITAFTDSKTFKVEIEPVAFGLKALKIYFVMDEKKGGTDKIEEDIANLDGVNSVEVIDVRRSIG